MKPDVRVRRVYDAASPADGARILVDRVWPRGLRKDAARLEDWAKDAAPSAELRKWYGHDRARFDEFRRRYLGELTGSVQRAALGRLRALASAGPVTLLTATRDVDHSQAAVLAQVLSQPAGAAGVGGVGEDAEEEGDVQGDEEAEPDGDAEPATGGEAACWAHLVCPECGAMVSEGHAPGCGSRPAAEPAR